MLKFALVVFAVGLVGCIKTTPSGELKGGVGNGWKAGTVPSNFKPVGEWAIGEK
jgi:hypothetical protein